MSDQQPLSVCGHVKRPFRFYATWVRANQSNVKSLESLLRTMALIMSSPGSIIGMEACWKFPRLFAMLNEAIICSTHRKISTPEVLGYFESALQEIEALIEVVIRQHSTHVFTWKAVLFLQGVKAILKVCAHQQMFLVPWMWDALKVAVRRVVRALMRPRGRQQVSSGGSKRSPRPSQLTGQAVGPNNTRLVIPRILSDRRQERQHYTPLGSSALHSGDDVVDEDAREAAETVPFTFVDVLGLVVDTLLVIRPMLLVWTAGRIFPHGSEAARIGIFPQKPVHTNNNNNKNKDGEKQQEDDGSEDFSIVAAALQATPKQSLFASWKWWGMFAVMDAAIVLLSRLIRAYRVPVVYITGDNSTSIDSLQNGGDGEDGGEQASTVPVGAATNSSIAESTVGVPAVVSRDTQRLQQALRNMVCTFIRDPFFCAVLKPFIKKRVLNGFLGRIPLVGSIIMYQLTYHMAMQHYSFLYTIGW